MKVDLDQWLYESSPYELQWLCEEQTEIFDRSNLQNMYNLKCGITL